MLAPSQGVKMPILEMRRRVKADADMVWQVISDVGGLADVAPHVGRVEILSGEKLGLRRRVYDRRGNSWTEEVIAWDEGKSYSMRVDTSGYPFLFSKMEFTWSVEEGPKNILIRMRYDYASKYGPFGGWLDRMRFRTRFEETCAQLMDNWIRVIHAREWAYRVTVATILEKKGGNVISVGPDDRVMHTANILRKNRIGSVVVIQTDGSIAGVVSERDIVRGLSDFGPGVMDQPVADIMTRKVVVAHPEDNMVLVMACMSDRRIRHLPVMDGDDLVGVISIGDVVKTRIQELEGESETLREYIEARRWRELYMEIGPAAYATMKDEIASGSS